LIIYPVLSPQRIEQIKSAISPLVIDLGSDNHRSPNSEINAFGDDILNCRSRSSGYAGISKLFYNPRIIDWNKIVRAALGVLQRHIQAATGNWGQNIAILVASGAAAVKISVGLNSAITPLPHKLLFDEAEAMLAARFAAFLLEPRSNMPLSTVLEQAIRLVADIKRANGLKEAEKLHDWADKVRGGKIPRAAFVSRLQGTLDRVGPFTGEPARDWISVKNELRASAEPTLVQVAKHLDYVVAFKRGKRISRGLTELWQRYGQYTNAREVLDAALAQDQLIDGVDDPDGIQLMTIHKAKGKQFDGVVVVRQGHHDGKGLISTFVWKGDSPPYHRSRKILRVAVTRAKVHALILDPFWPKCPILGAYSL
jgi:DNA helicase-2/ATP-dependent DNA helicase PcrA